VKPQFGAPIKTCIIACCVSLAFVATACTRPGQSFHEPNTLVVVQQREPMSLNPALENGASSTEWGLLLFQYLVKYDDHGKLVGDAAVAVPTLQNGGISRDGLTITYRLRRGLRFADGSPLTANDCVWSIAAIVNPANNVQTRYGYDRIAKAQARDATTLVLHLKQPFAPLLTLVLAPSGFPILPAHLLARYPDFNNLAFNGMPLGSGPYVVTRWLRGDAVEMRPNPYYWRRAPRIAHLVVRFVADPNTAIDLLRTKEADGFFNDEDLGNYELLRTISGIRVNNTPVNAVGALIFNTQDSPTNDTRVRHALAQALNFQTLVRTTYRGALTSDSAGRGLFIWAYDKRAYPDVPYDTKAAAALLDAAGWKLGNDGVRHRDGRELNLLLIIQAATPGDQVIGNQIAFYEGKIGARVTLKAFNETQFVAPGSLGGPVYGGKFQMAYYPFVNGDDPDTTDQFACSHVPPNGYNKSRICDPQLDALLDAARRTYDVAARKALYAKVQTLLYRELPIALLYQRREVDAFSDRVQGQTTSLSGAFWNAGSWTMKQSL
jgi:peptide/nickel transport system substrate-binding protein